VSEKSSADPGPIVEVAVERVALENLPERYEAPGTVAAFTETVLSSEVMGRVRAVHVREGSTVRQGQILISIDDRSARSRLEEAEAAVRLARVGLEEARHGSQSAEAALEAARANAHLALTTFQRYGELLDRDSVSRQEYDEVKAQNQSAQAELLRAEQALAAARLREQQAEAQITQAEAARRSADVGLEHTGITAPFSGVVTERRVEPGDLAYPGRPLLTLEARGRYQLHVNVNESVAADLSLDQPVEVSLPSIRQTLTTEIEEIVPAADPSTRTVLVKLRLPPHPEVRSGMFGRAYFSIGEISQLLIPETAVIRRGQLVGVWIADAQERVRFQLIKIGRTRGERVEILSGLEEGDLIITEPAPIRDGQRIRVVTTSQQ